jgi:dynein heavy chain 2
MLVMTMMLMILIMTRNLLQAATAVVSKSGAIDWEAIHGLMEDAIYGGRIDNAFDVRVLKAYLK